MNCCVECFKDAEIKGIIEGVKLKGACDFCKKANVYVCDISNENLKENFERLLDVYSPISNIEVQYPREKADLIKNKLCFDWNIFKLTPDKVYLFLTNLLSEKYKEEPKLFDEAVLVKSSINKASLEVYSMMGESCWENFVDEIKSKNRFHITSINKEILKKLLKASCKKYPKGTEFFRARRCKESSGFSKEAMGAPPSSKASAGRANPEGISCLYLANEPKTTVHEIRAGAYDLITVGKFVLKEEISIVNLDSIDKISPFYMDDMDLIAVNLDNLKKIGKEISRPLRSSDSSLDYLPTQYICDYIKKIGFKGIQYKSTLCSRGANFAIFDEKLLNCEEVYNYNVNELNYSYDEMES